MGNQLILIQAVKYGDTEARIDKAYCMQMWIVYHANLTSSSERSNIFTCKYTSPLNNISHRVLTQTKKKMRLVSCWWIPVHVMVQLVLTCELPAALYSAPTICMQDGGTALIKAAKTNRAELAELLIKSGANIEHQDKVTQWKTRSRCSCYSRIKQH